MQFLARNNISETMATSKCKKDSQANQECVCSKNVCIMFQISTVLSVLIFWVCMQWRSHSNRDHHWCLLLIWWSLVHLFWHILKAHWHAQLDSAISAWISTSYSSGIQHQLFLQTLVQKQLKARNCKLTHGNRGQMKPRCTDTAICTVQLLPLMRHCRSFSVAQNDW